MTDSCHVQLQQQCMQQLKGQQCLWIPAMLCLQIRRLSLTTMRQVIVTVLLQPQNIRTLDLAVIRACSFDFQPCMCAMGAYTLT